MKHLDDNRNNRICVPVHEIRRYLLLTVRICRVVVKDAASSPVEAAQHDKMSLILWLPAETLLAHREEAAVFDGRRAKFTCEDDSIDEHDGNMVLFEMRLDFLNGHRAAGRRVQNDSVICGISYKATSSICFLKRLL